MRMIVIGTAIAVLVVASAPNAFADQKEDAPPMVASDLEQLPVMLGQTAQGLTAKVSLEAKTAAAMANKETSQFGSDSQRWKQQSQSFVRDTANQTKELHTKVVSELQQTTREAELVQHKTTAEIASAQLQAEIAEKKTRSAMQQMQDVVRHISTTVQGVVRSTLNQFEAVLQWLTRQVAQAKSRVN